MKKQEKLRYFKNLYKACRRYKKQNRTLERGSKIRIIQLRKAGHPKQWHNKMFT